MKPAVLKPILVGGIFLSALVTILWVGVASASIPVFKIRAMLHDKPTGPLRIDDGKIAEIESLLPLRFKVSPKSDPQTFVWVESKRTVPENFKTDVDVGLEGKYDAKTGVFHAYRISTQCPSKYEASKDAEKAYAGANKGYGATDADLLPGTVGGSASGASSDAGSQSAVGGY
jgi:hypothetical protein